MTRDEYLNKLKDNLRTLTTDERDEAISYYQDYFNEADNDSKVMEELGTPEQLAEVIKAKLSNSLTTKNSQVKKEEADSDSSKTASGECSDGLYFEFASDAVKNLVVDLKASDTVLISGNKFAVETRGIDEKSLNCYLRSDCSLIINNNGVPKWNLFAHSKRVRVAPRILITIPENIELENVSFSLGAGNCRSKDIAIRCKKGSFDVGAGNLELKSVFGGVLSFRCGMGNLSLCGALQGTSLIDCGMGNISLNLKGNPSDYSYDAKVGLGHFKFNDEKKAGFCQEMDNQKKQNHFSANIGMGSVEIKVEQ